MYLDEFEIQGKLELPTKASGDLVIATVIRSPQRRPGEPLNTMRNTKINWGREIRKASRQLAEAAALSAIPKQYRPALNAGRSTSTLLNIKVKRVSGRQNRRSPAPPRLACGGERAGITAKG